MEKISWEDFLLSGKLSWDFEIGSGKFSQICPSAISCATIELLHKAVNVGAPGLLVSCADYGWESICTAFALALDQYQYLQPAPLDFNSGSNVAIFDQVFKIKSSSENELKLTRNARNKKKNDRIFERINKCEFGILHHTGRDELSFYEDGALNQFIEKYKSLPHYLKKIIDCVDMLETSVGLATSPSHFMNEAPTSLKRMTIRLDDEEVPLMDFIPTGHISASGELELYSTLACEATPALISAHRVSGAADLFCFNEYIDEGRGRLSALIIEISSVEQFEMMRSDFEDLIAKKVPTIVFCDRWTMSHATEIAEMGFLELDWDDGQSILLDSHDTDKRLSAKEENLRSHRTVAQKVVKEGYWPFSQVLLTLREIDKKRNLLSLESSNNLATLNRVLNEQMKQTEMLHTSYSENLVRKIDEAANALVKDIALNSEEKDLVRAAENDLKELCAPNRALPKENEVYFWIKDKAKHRTGKIIIIVHKARSEEALRYWLDEIETKEGIALKNRLKVERVSHFLRRSALTEEDSVLFCGWFDRGTMDRLLNSGIINRNALLLLYRGEKGSELETNWYLAAENSWQCARASRARRSLRTLSKLCVEAPDSMVTTSKIKAPFKNRQAENGDYDEGDPSLHASIMGIEKRSLEMYRPKTGEGSFKARPVFLSDGTVEWLAEAGCGGSLHGGGSLHVVTDIVNGSRDACEPEKKNAYQLMPGDVILKVQKDRKAIQAKAQENGLRDSTYALARVWHDPIDRALKSMTQEQIVKRIIDGGCERSESTIRLWICDKERIAPRDSCDIRAIYNGLGENIDQGDIERMLEAASSVRGRHRAAGRMLTDEIAEIFVNDVLRYGVQKTIEHFPDRHKMGEVDLVTVEAVGDIQDVAEQFVYGL